MQCYHLRQRMAERKIAVLAQSVRVKWDDNQPGPLVEII